MQGQLYEVGEGDIYRPPSEAHSLIIRVTTGCSWNRCTFCGMFRDRRFSEVPTEGIVRQIAELYPCYAQAERAFLADGNALALPTQKLLDIFSELKGKFRRLGRIGIYGGPQDILHKAPQDLLRLREAGLGIIYIGLESGSDAVLRDVKKGVTAAEMAQCARMVKDAGILLSVIAIAGLGGKKNSRIHAMETGKTLSAMDPDYAGILTLMLVRGTPLARDYESGKFELVGERGILEEIRAIVENFNATSCVFRANHASNYMPIGGTLPRDKEKILASIDRALGDGSLLMRPEWMRAL